jgi:hypothetical protein
MNTQLIQQIAEEQILQIFIDVQAELARKIDELYLDDYQSDRLTESIAMVHENNKQKYLRGLATTGELPAGPQINRLEVIDYYNSKGRALVQWADDLAVELSYQDEGRTLKIFISKKDGSTPVAPKEEGEA